MSKEEKDYRKDPFPGSGPYIGRMRAEFQVLERFQQWANARLADNECKHGSLPGDRVIKCICWGNPAPTSARVARERLGGTAA